MGTIQVLIDGGWQGTSSTMEKVFSECLPRQGGNSSFGVFRMVCATSINIPTEWLSRQDGDWSLCFQTGCPVQQVQLNFQTNIYLKVLE